MLAVVIIHVLSNNHPANTDANKLNWWVNNIVVISLRWCVPIFIMLSGALLLNPHKQENIITFFKKRFSRIGIPLITWSIIYYFWRIHQHTIRSNTDYLKEIFVYGYPYYHLYFIYIIAGLYILVPIIKSYLRTASINNQRYLLIILFIISSFSSMMDLWFRNFWHLGSVNTLTYALPFIGYFMTGYYLKNKILTHKYKIYLLITYVLTVIIGAVGTYLLMNQYGYTSKGEIFQDYLNPNTIIMSIAIFLLINSTRISTLGNISQHRIFQHLANTSLGIYLSHPIFMNLFEIYWQQDLLIKFSPILVNIIIKIPFVFISSWLLTTIIIKMPYIKKIVGSR